MPQYDYLCKKCSHEWEEDQPILDPPVEKCPKCHKKSAARQIGRPMFVLKGGGWADDGYDKSYKPD